MNEPSSDDLWKAYHEAGHAVAAYAHGGVIQRVSIIATERYQGVCLFSMNRTFQTYSHRPAINKHTCQIVISLAGPAAQARFAPESCEPEQARVDREDALKSLARIATVRGDSAHELAYYEELADRFIYEEENWVAIEALAAAVGRRKSLFGSTATQIIDRVWKEYYQ